MNNDGRQDSFLYKPWVRLAIALGVLLAVAVVIVYVFVYARLGLRWYLSPTNDLSITQRKDLVQGLASMGQALAVGLTGAAAFIGLAFTWRNLRETRESTQRTLEIAEQAQITDSFTRAIELLGATNDGTNNENSMNVEQRIGAIYALEQIAKESDVHHNSIMEILSAYVRKNSPRTSGTEAAFEAAEVAPEPTEAAPEPTEAAMEITDPGRGLGHRKHDIQAIINVIGRRSQERAKSERNRILLGDTDLRDAIFMDLESGFAGSWFHNADLRGASFVNPNLENAWFVFADLRGSYFHEHTKLQGANFAEAKLEDALLSRVDLTGVANITQEQLDQALVDEDTKLPRGLRQTEHSGDKQDDQQAGDLDKNASSDT
jgi:Pentapeptide repeats (8 copies)